MLAVRIAVPLLLSGALLAPVLAQTNPHAGHAMPAASASAPAPTSAKGEGTVKKIDKAQGSAVLAHGALSDGMPAMTMAYRFKDTASLDKLQVGQKLRFEVQGDLVLRWEAVK